jgi:hypothetical protein
LLKLDAKTGILTIDDYQFSPHNTIEELLEKYTGLQFDEMESGRESLFYRAYSLPPSDLDRRHIEVRLTASVQYVSLISFNPLYKTDKGRNNYSDKKLLDWVKTAQAWLVKELGKPHETIAYSLLDEDKRFKPEELEFFKSWEYHFDWGKASFYYDSFQITGAIFIGYDYNYQIASWDELLQQCDYIEAEAKKYPSINRDNFQAIRELIEHIRDDLDYKTVRPRTSVDKLLFHPKALGKTRVVVTADVRHPNEIYNINRTDVRHEFQTSDKESLLKILKLFLESTKLEIENILK